jgi:hypothetical protein
MEIIKGLKIRVESAELKKKFEERAEHHSKRAEFCKQKLALLKEPVEAGMDDPEFAAEAMVSNIGTPKQRIQSRVVSHGSRAAFFKFMADHIIPDVVYEIEEDDLFHLEILRKDF